MIKTQEFTPAFFYTPHPPKAVPLLPQEKAQVWSLFEILPLHLVTLQNEI